MTETRMILGILLLIGGLSTVSATADAEGPDAGPVQYYVLTDSPISGPVETSVLSDHPTASRGTVTDVFLVVQNHSNEATVSIDIDLELIYADGRPVRPFRLGRDSRHTLGPDEGVGFFVFILVPEDAPLGTATFRASARVGHVSGGDDGHANNPNPMIASDFIEFEVVP